MAETPHGQSCATCRYSAELPDVPSEFDADGNEFEILRCRRFPPSRHESAGDLNEASWYPRVYGVGWCGEYAPANPETVEDGAATMARLVLLGDLTAARALADKLLGGD